MKNLKEEKWRLGLKNDPNAVVIDVRTPAEWNDGIIPESVMANIMGGPDFVEKMRSWDKSKEYYVYCRSGNRSFHACRAMAKEGFTCYNLEGGILAWKGEIVEPITH
ncbi:MAG: rhodanese-like domain-containing protein [Flavobacteriales bacterium]|nr:rhodanese-like domain-containing protein [Flavobacteriales bacterium]